MVDVCVGVGFRAAAGSLDILAAVRQLLTSADPSSETTSEMALHCLSTQDRKAGEPALLDAASALGVPVRGFAAGELAAVDVANPSERVRSATGSPSVAEAAAVLGAGGGPLIVTKWSANGVVVAAARKVS
ncbi:MULTISPECIES: cobalamin biosynthesis protein [unclassified Rhodococcus (in: high G+C Gram-positive bacteria)]|uniref:cobalamin biosynthesis protein n=1 Tax=unclassified Rhodococcus (in: high G+C Gram-positive bacteria) TaxID=192944 RepID=UPI00163A5D24|nr:MULTISPECIES: cobalamin biosynthesis protein [unclassified Rhodococcus (in: high G+C Gram-positive bacteria)]MBC2643793.1 cobalamin biosynthesis protein [Rhodococcus sp. 3A]MBC2891466.1 cobalamin biosynthesis protein [Rhodococcus sp. 4CII]